MARLNDKVALITGAARGIGAAIAEAFVREGARVWVTDLDAAGSQALAERLGPQARAARLDVREEAQWQAVLADVLARDGGLQVLVNNAGISGLEGGAVHNPEQAELLEWRAVHATNLDGVFLGCKHGIRAMRASGGVGSIINISSRSGLVGIPAAAAYASSKAAVRNHSKTVALYCAEQGLKIRCNSIHPGAILTPMWEPMLGEGAQREANLAAFTADTPLRRFGRPEEVAAVALMLASDEAAYMTGSELHIDGGLLAGTAVRPQSGPQEK
ncbi:NAD(P)-dependent dehydrogenase (short-subunit alcohol dehydrogenase family) [Inhella inkyongensis]|uniref:NAD(P)-dependent dehydrogenase (Short-subunit alcohol dehydrogenase family) n=1 Tax=Inhella inkyongensis TaxID=392593 RepID=A0A840S818_9BURK|nr:SDR family oxidoreductase [Inhella inkyongensis]MBB5204579.1 NAD(P)-dependent dehydrogenase (short-subunit alcohol dehydrogenase family) [Inhella inkyongensis]